MLQVPTGRLLSGLADTSEPPNQKDAKLPEQQLLLPEAETFLYPWKAVNQVFQKVEGRQNLLKE